MAEPVEFENITIVGGGTAGWLTAIILVTYLKWQPEADDVTITLIESPNVPTVGVGEATVPGMSLIMKQCGIDEADFFRRTNATFKMGVLFRHWNEWADGRPRDPQGGAGGAAAPRGDARGLRCAGRSRPAFFCSKNGSADVRQAL